MHPDPQQPTNPPTPPLIESREALARRRRQGGGRWLGGLSILGALLFTLGTLLVLTLPGPAPDQPESVAEPTPTTLTPTQAVPTAVVALPTEARDAPDTTVAERLPTLNPNIARQTLLATPVDQLAASGGDGAGALRYDPFTIIPERPRGTFTEYVAVRGDTISSIAQRYGLQAESIAWCNDRRIIFTLRPGDRLTIPPIDGVCHRVLGTRQQTIAEIARQYQIDDPFVVIDSPFNSLFERSPDDILPGGTNVFIPGGQGELITWDPGYERDETTGTSAFAPGQAGSCGAVSGGGTVWGNPLAVGRWMRGFFPGHTGIDLAAPEGTPIYAANGGPVMFSGWSSWGYGNTVVLAHGARSTLYAHMSQRAVQCGQTVGTGQIIGYVGNTGNSSGPHLHFEIRVNGTPVDPAGTPGLGW